MTGALALGSGLLLILPLAGLNPFLLDLLTSGFFLASRITSYNVCYTKLLRLFYDGSVNEA